MKLYSVYDSKAEAYLPIFESATHATAIRSFETAVKQDGTPFNLYPGDYTLFCVGSKDELTGVVSPEEPSHINLGMAQQYTAAQESLNLVEPFGAHAEVS